MNCNNEFIHTAFLMFTSSLSVFFPLFPDQYYYCRDNKDDDSRCYPSYNFPNRSLVSRQSCVDTSLCCVREFKARHEVCCRVSPSVVCSELACPMTIVANIEKPIHINLSSFNIHHLQIWARRVGKIAIGFCVDSQTGGI